MSNATTAFRLFDLGIMASTASLYIGPNPPATAGVTDERRSMTDNQSLMTERNPQAAADVLQFDGRHLSAN
jgi:hypothetical protein